jgi:hypothetical protein
MKLISASIHVNRARGTGVTVQGKFGWGWALGTPLYQSQRKQRSLNSKESQLTVVMWVAAVQFCVKRRLCLDPRPLAGTAELPGEEHTALNLWGHVSKLPAPIVPLHHMQSNSSVSVPVTV